MSDQDQPARRVRRSFTTEFKRDAVALVLDGNERSADVARSLDVGESNLGNWVRCGRPVGTARWRTTATAP